MRHKMGFMLLFKVPDLLIVGSRQFPLVPTADIYYPANFAAGLMAIAFIGIYYSYCRISERGLLKFVADIVLSHI